jgi:hypothetical protein
MQCYAMQYMPIRMSTCNIPNAMVLYTDGDPAGPPFLCPARPELPMPTETLERWCLNTWRRRLPASRVIALDRHTALSDTMPHAHAQTYTHIPARHAVCLYSWSTKKYAPSAFCSLSLSEFILLIRGRLTHQRLDLHLSLSPPCRSPYRISAWSIPPAVPSVPLSTFASARTLPQL